MTRVEARALGAVGARFRLGGRSPEHGLDCVGLVAWAMEVGDAPSGYALRGGVPERVVALLDARLTRVGAAEPGDVLLFAAGPGQLHLAVASARGVIHADAGLSGWWSGRGRHHGRCWGRGDRSPAEVLPSPRTCSGVQRCAYIALGKHARTVGPRHEAGVTIG